MGVDDKRIKEIMLESERRNKVMRIGDDEYHWVNVAE